MLSCALTLFDVVCSCFLFVFFFLNLQTWLIRLVEKFKTKANRTFASSSSSPSQLDKVRFLSIKTEEIFEILTKYRSIWGERQIFLDELDPSIYRNLVSRKQVSLCDVSDPPATALIREFYSNLSVSSEVIGGHYLTTWIRGKEFKITKLTVFEALSVPLVHKPTFPYTEFPPLDDIMSLLCGRSISQGFEPRKNSCEFTKLNYLYLRISQHNIYPIFGVCIPLCFHH